MASTISAGTTSGTAIAISGDTTGQLDLKVNNGTTAVSIDTSSNLKFNSGYGSVVTAYGCRAWVNFNGTGTVAIRGSGNVSSITDNGSGRYTINFSTAMPDANYATSLAGEDTGAGAQNTEAMAIASGGVAAGSVGVTNIGFSGSFTDLPTVCVSIFR